MFSELLNIPPVINLLFKFWNKLLSFIIKISTLQIITTISPIKKYTERIKLYNLQYEIFSVTHLKW